MYQERHQAQVVEGGDHILGRLRYRGLEFLVLDLQGSQAEALGDHFTLGLREGSCDGTQ